ncbi:IclR family transcriptional regulator [Parasulfitobacter algicola]|uniref:IclR family transcriptional regulator n=1 Tax=Parasulfitobacter algicola TaxID=2614809 RepID=A0ABX2IRQ8_9RHOB|nr:IclR family transcriptional regulator [Sulfitobacter algicola]NSX54995.1 IclR family transcriptional regulator [Sulfitobacter algicola]
MTKPETDRRFANTLARGLSLLRAFRASDDGLTHSELAERTGLPNSTVSRLTFTLSELGFLSHAGRMNRYRLGPAALALGNVAAASVSFVEVGHQILQDLADQTGTLVSLAVRDGEKVMLAKTWRPVGAASIWLEPGHRIPVFGSSSGRAIVAALDDTRFQAMNPSDALCNFRSHGYDQLIAQGFTIAPPETRYSTTVNAVAVPFHAQEFGEPVAFSCGALPEALTDDRMCNDVGPALRDSVRELERITGRSPALVRRG